MFLATPCLKANYLDQKTLIKVKHVDECKNSHSKVKIKATNQHFDDKVRIKVEHIDELKHSNEGVKIKIEPTNQLKHFDSELKGKAEELQSKVVCQNHKLNIHEGEGGKNGLDYYIDRLYNFNYRKFLKYVGYHN